MSKIQESRIAYKPFDYPWAYDIWKRHEQAHWIAHEVPLHEDVKDWKNRLSAEEKSFLTQIFRFFTQSDIDVSEGYVDYLPKFEKPEIRMMLMGFGARESIHIDAYSHLIETLGMDESTYTEFLEYESMAEKHDYFMKHLGDDTILPIKIAAISAFTEGLALFSSFIMLLNFPRHGKMKGMGQIVSWSMVDETIHCEGMIRLFREFVEENLHIWNDDTKSKIYTIAEKMVELEDNFVDLAFGMGDMENLTKEDVKKYIRYIADRRLITMGMKGIFGVKKNPLPWVEEMINAPIHTNFFENVSTDYAKGSMKGDWSEVWA